MTMASRVGALKWSSQFSLSSTLETPRLSGDKIILPPSALEQLLTAATVPVPHEDHNPHNPYPFSEERQSRPAAVERQQQLPHPLTFRLINPKNNRLLYAGVREFTAAEGQVVLSPYLRNCLGLRNAASLSQRQNAAVPSPSAPDSSLIEDGDRITVHLQELPKGTYVKLRPLEAGYDPEDWKALLEKYLRDNFTTLTRNEILSVPADMRNYEFLVDELKPGDEAISLVDTDLAVDIEALNEEQARETLKQQLQKSQKAPSTYDINSAGGILAVGEDLDGQVTPGDYIDYTIQQWDRTDGIEVDLTALDNGSDVDLFITPFGSRQRSRPRETEHVLGDFSANTSKKLVIPYLDAELSDVTALWISVRGHHRLSEMGTTESDRPIRYQLRTSYVMNSRTAASKTAEADPTVTNPDEELCTNCHQPVPRGNMVLHQNFCFRNNSLCPRCKGVFQRSSPMWTNRWDCRHDSAHGHSRPSLEKHEELFHTPQSCRDCAYQAHNMPALAHHRTTTCPRKLILCSFCHLQVPQKGLEDPDFHSPEVALSGLTPHEFIEGARTTECHLCARIVRFRDLSAHLKHHDLQRLSRSKPRICRNINCGRTLDVISPNGESHQQASHNDLGVCGTCYGPLYASIYDPEGKALRRRVERKYLMQLLTGCGQSWCENQFCKTGLKNRGLPGENNPATSKDALARIKPHLGDLGKPGTTIHFCTDEASQRRRVVAEIYASENHIMDAKEKEKENRGTTGTYDVEWWIAALEISAGDVERAQTWLKHWAPTRAELAK